MVDITKLTDRIKILVEKNPHILAVYLLGSVANGSMRLDSDIDLGVMLVPGSSVSSVEKMEFAGIISYEFGRTVDIGVISSKNLVYAREVLLKGKPIFLREKNSVNLVRANLLGMYLQFNMDRQEVVHAYRAG